MYVPQQNRFSVHKTITALVCRLLLNDFMVIFDLKKLEVSHEKNDENLRKKARQKSSIYKTNDPAILPGVA